MGSVAATDFYSDCNAASDIASISTYEKLGVTTSVLSISASTSVSVLKQFSAKISQYQAFNDPIQQSRKIISKKIAIPA